MAKVDSMDRITLFDADVLKEIDYSKGDCKMNQYGLSCESPGEDLRLRPLASDDYDKERFNAMRDHHGTYYIIVVENTKADKILASGSLIVEQKFIHEIALRGRIEDIVVDDSCRGRRIGQLIVETLLLLSEKLGCYKTSLECRDPLLGFYKKFGFQEEKDQNHLIKRFFH
ncbi:glucosamine 6-phosphate N-acetyltransferase isoform X2 [Nematostella vectensis]|uniref:glucosamine 6-phosphate N-acetyltransferase isoform X2 n=1 Tax=Nematostella vectensis TaxID=45351 RepID=UPI0020775156|nr:glucosamine 6-phosphate N-acetyltransferase isoform X2 [Nematostella vectensis]